MPNSTGATKETSLHLAARTWLIEAVDLAEEILSGTPVGHDLPPRADVQDVSSTGRDLTSGAVTSLTYLCSNPGPSSQPSLVLLERAHRLCDLAKVCSTASERANFLHCVTATAQTIAGQYWRKDKYNEALAFGTASCSGAKEAIDLYAASDTDGNLDEEDAKAIGSLRNSLLKRYELVGACHVKLSDRKVSSGLDVGGANDARLRQRHSVKHLRRLRQRSLRRSRSAPNSNRFDKSLLVQRKSRPSYNGSPRCSPTIRNVSTTLVRSSMARFTPWDRLKSTPLLSENSFYTSWTNVEDLQQPIRWERSCSSWGPLLWVCTGRTDTQYVD